MINSTLCYLERGDAYLMLHRVKKKGDLNHDKWIGVGGKFEDGESPEDCMFREVNEETGLHPPGDLGGDGPDADGLPLPGPGDLCVR